MSTVITVDGKSFECDNEIIALVRWLNESGYETRYSCQGHESKGGYFYRPYIAFSGDAGKKLARKLGTYLYRKNLVGSESIILEEYRVSLSHCLVSLKVFSDSQETYSLTLYPERRDEVGLRTSREEGFSWLMDLILR